MTKRILLIKAGLFCLILGALLLVNNQYHMQDEYRFAVSLDQGIRIFYAQHMLSNFNGYVVWFLSTILRINIGAYRALQVASCVFAAMGAVALIDLGIFWGLKLRYAILFSLPIIFSNAFVRYGTSAYPDAAAMGLGLVAINLLCRAVARQKEVNAGILPKPLYFSGLIAGLCVLEHLVFAIVISGFALGIITGLRQLKKPFKNIRLACFVYLSGIATTLAIGYGFFMLLFKTAPQYAANVESNLVNNLKGVKELWMPNLPEFLKAMKTFGALFIPGFHSSNQILDLIYELPRVISVLVAGWLLINALRTAKSKPGISSWIIPMLLSILTLFFTMLFLNYWFSRQYAMISLAAFGPLYLALGILTLGGKSFLSRFSLIIISGVFLFYMVFGIEGIADVSSHNSGGLRKHIEKCDIFRPKPVQFPWNPDKSSMSPECRFAYDTLG